MSLGCPPPARAEDKVFAWLRLIKIVKVCGRLQNRSHLVLYPGGRRTAEGRRKNTKEETRARLRSGFCLL